MITADELKQVSHYDPDTGIFTWRVSVTGWIKVGAAAGASNGDGYRRIKLLGTRYYAHRLAWLYMTGKWPVQQIDHINGDARDNRYANLRDVPAGANQQNVSNAQRNNLSGFLGVTKGRYGFIAKIKADGKRYYLGTFRSAEAAHDAYMKAKERLHAGFNPERSKIAQGHESRAPIRVRNRTNRALHCPVSSPFPGTTE